MYTKYCNICKKEVKVDLIWVKTYHKKAVVEHHYICLDCKGNFTVIYSKENEK